MTNLVPVNTSIMAVAHATSNLSMPDNTNAVVAWTDVDYDPHGFFNLGSSTTRWVVPTGLGGYFRASFATRITNLSDPAIGYATCWYNVNGNGGPELSIPFMVLHAGTAGRSWRFVHNGVLLVAAGEYVEIVLFQTNGLTEHLAGTTETSYSSRFSLERLGT